MSCYILYMAVLSDAKAYAYRLGYIYKHHRFYIQRGFFLKYIAAHIAISKSKFFKGKKILKAGSFVLMVLICLSTVFLKQHSVLDGIYAVILAFILYILIYSRISVFEFIKLYKKISKSCSKKNQ